MVSHWEVVIPFEVVAVPKQPVIVMLLLNQAVVFVVVLLLKQAVVFVVVLVVLPG